MSNDWGKPFTPEELAKLPGAKQVTTAWPDYQQAPKPEYVEGPDAWPAHPDQLSPMTVGPEEWGEPLTTDDPEHPDCAAPYAERTAPVDTFSEADGPWYVVYFGPVLYTVLAGPYETQEAAEERIDRVWAQFEHDAAYDFSFPQRERSGLRATTVRSVFNLKGAYGKQ